MIDVNLKSLLDNISQIKNSNSLKKYIDFIQFPFYRNMEIDTRINFNFPLTVFIGPNGCGKSSCLHALYGAPKNNTPYEFWFDTKVDPIEYYNDQRKRHSFWYSFIDENKKGRQVVKARIKRGDNPNYWETSRPLIWVGMEKKGNKNLRDTPIEKNVVYIDFRAELSAFDKYFYFGNTKGLQSSNKQEYIKRKSSYLKNILSGEREIYYNGSKKLNEKIRTIQNEELKWISFILGKKYVSGKFLVHSFFRNEGYSVIFNTSYAEYSEAFAGSGEVAVVRLVLRVLDASKYSLILLDEPEVSLHPGAQSRLTQFLFEQIKIKKHQIILTSHSPSIIKGLPKEAIKVFHQNPNTGRFLVKENLSHEEAFFHIEFPITEKFNITTEDILGENILNAVLNHMGEETKNLFNIKFNPGGVSVLKKEFMTVYCRESNSKEFIFFDGDQRISEKKIDWKDLPNSELNSITLKSRIKEQINETINFSIDSGDATSKEIQQVKLLKQYSDYLFTNVMYFPQQIPEEIIWDDEYARLQIKSIKSNNEHSKCLEELSSINDFKSKFSFISEIIYGDNSSESILNTQKQFIQKWINSDNNDLNEIVKCINNIANRA